MPLRTPPLTETASQSLIRSSELAPHTRRVLGGDHPITRKVDMALREAREALRYDVENARGKAECVQKALRFPVGTRVECRVDGLDGWHKGRVVNHWYREWGMPPGQFMTYQIELDRGGLIMASHDDDKMIRRPIE